MDVFKSLVDYIIILGCFLCFLMALEQLIGTNRNRVNNISSVLFLLNGVLLFHLFGVINNLYLQYPGSFFFSMTSLYLIGPFYLAYYTSLNSHEKNVMQKLKIHLIPALLVFIGEIIFQFQPENLKIDILEGTFISGDVLTIKILAIAGIVMVVSHLLYILKKVFSSFSEKSTASGAIVFVILVSCSIITLVFIMLAFLMDLKVFYVTGGIIFGIVQATIFLGYKAYPGFFCQALKDVHKKKYENTMLKGMDTETLFEKLMYAMKYESLYRNFDLSLKSLAERLDVTPHQLSEYLNKTMNVNFANFVNSHRVEEAKKMLLGSAVTSVTSVCYAVGFNSKPTFNIVFKKMSGMSPTEFRISNLKNQDFRSSLS